MNAPLVLVADDDPLLLRLLELRLQRAGYDVATARDGLAAVEFLNVGKPDVVVLDAMMPRMGGFEVLRHIRAQPSQRHVRVLMLTLLRHQDDIVSAFRQGADEYLVDWYNNRRLLEPIGNIPPAEAEAAYFAALEETAIAA